MEDLSDASFLGKLLVLPANVGLDWKVFARCKHSSLFGLVISDEEKRFYKIVFSSSMTKGQTKQERVTANLLQERPGTCPEESV